MFIDIIVADQDTYWETLYILLIGIIICGLLQVLINYKLHNFFFLLFQQYEKCHICELISTSLETFRMF